MQLVYHIEDAMHREEVNHIFSIKAVDTNENGETVEFPALAAINDGGMVVILTREDLETIEEVNDFIASIKNDHPIDFSSGKLVSYLSVEQLAAMRNPGPQPEGEIPPDVFAQMQANGELPFAMQPIAHEDADEEEEPVDVVDDEEVEETTEEVQE